MVINELTRRIASELTDNAYFEAEQIVMRALGIDRVQLITDGGRKVTASEKEAADALLFRRKKGEPLAYILGECEFMSLPFCVGDGVLVPRADTETLAESVINRARGDEKILDICAGSGCVGISLAHFLKNTEVTLLDISDKAISACKKNIETNCVHDRVHIKKCDILTEYPCDKFNIIVSNPPYIETAVIDTLAAEVRDFEPRIALDGGRDGLVFYRRITEIAPRMLFGGGILAFEIGFDQGEAVSTLMQKNFINIEIIKDLAGNDRVVIGNIK